MTAWHLEWQRAVPPERREVVMPPHRADIVTASGGVVEIQHSSISVDMITKREEFYGERMAWIFDARGATISRRALPPPCDCTYEGCGRFRAVRQATPWATVLFRWYSPRRTITACRRPVFLDLGRGEILRLPGPFMPSRESPGALYTRTSIEGWLKDGTPLDRIMQLSAPAPCRGARPFKTTAPVPAVPPSRHQERERQEAEQRERDERQAMRTRMTQQHLARTGQIPQPEPAQDSPPASGFIITARLRKWRHDREAKRAAEAAARKREAAQRHD